MILLAGSGRSGTTWLTSMIQVQAEFRVIFEPFHYVKVPEAGSFGPNRYVKPDDRTPELVAVANKVLSGQIRCQWTEQMNSSAECDSQQLLIKCIFGNLMLAWLRSLRPSIKLILIVRHPIAVALSKAKMDKCPWMKDPKLFLAQDDLVADHLCGFDDLLLSARTLFERHILIWAIEYYVPLRTLAPEHYHLVFYEDLCESPRDETASLFRHLSLDLPVDRAPEEQLERVIRQPSLTSRRESAIVKGESLLDTWVKEVTDDQVQSSLQLLEPFGLHELYGEGTRPKNRKAKPWFDKVRKVSI